MLIELEVKIKLPVIVFFILYEGVFEKFVDVILNKQRMSKDSHDLNDWAPDLMVMFNDTNETVRDDGNVYLNTNCILGFTPKTLDLKMLFNPLKEQLDLPSIFIKERNLTCFEVEIVRIVCEGSLQFWSIIDNASEGNGIVALVSASCESDRLVTKDIVLSFKQVLTIFNLIVRVEFLPDNEEGTSLFNGKESRQVKVSTVKYVAGKSLIFNPVHRVDIMDLCRSDSVEYRYLSSNVNLCVNPDTSLCTSEFRPSEDRETETDGCRIDSIESSMKFKLFGDSSLLSLADHIEGEIFINSVITESVGFGDGTSVRGCRSETEIVRTFGMSLDYVNEFPETGTARKLRKYKHTKMVPMSKTPFLSPVVISADNTIELTFEPVCYLVEDIVPNMHNRSNLKLGTKVRISKVGHYSQELLYCA